MLADLLGVSCGGNLTLSTFCPNLFCKIPLDKLFHACYILSMFRYSPHRLTLPLALVWWFAVLSPNGEIVYSNHRDKATCETPRNAYARVRSLTVTTCQTLTQQEKEEKHYGYSA